MRKLIAAVVLFCATCVGADQVMLAIPHNWTPAELSSADLVAWFDAADADTITSAGGLVSQWDDKSGNTNNLVQAVGSEQPGYAFDDKVSFDGTSDNMASSFTQPVPFSVFLVCNVYTGEANVDVVLDGYNIDTIDFRYDSNPGEMHAYSDGYITETYPYTNGELNMASIRVRNSGSGTSDIYKNGALHEASSINSQAPGGLSVGKRRSGGRNGKCDIRELILVNSFIDQTEQQKIEGYLAWKWGLEGELPVGHPYKSVAPQAALKALAIPQNWTPSDITTVAWFDASDTNTITSAGGLVSQWDDKSGNTNDATQGTGSKQPATGTNTINGLNTLSFSGGAKILDTALTQLSNSVSIYLVLDADQKPPSNNNAPLGSTVAYNSGGLHFNVQNYDTQAPWNSVYYTTSQTNKYLNGVSGAQGHGWNPAIFSHSGTNLTTQGLPYRIGTAKSGGGEEFLGEMCEIIICPADHDTDTRQKIEGYLAHKWGIEANLPSDHPYKNAAPLNAANYKALAISQNWTPSDITTEAWYDASDTNTITSAGGLVSQWDDKSGNSRHVSQATGSQQPTAGTNEINGLPAIYFAGADDICLVTTNAAETTDTSKQYFFVWSPSGAGPYAGYLYAANIESNGIIRIKGGGNTTPRALSLSVSSSYNTSLFDISDVPQFGSCEVDKVTPRARVFQNAVLRNTDNSGSFVSLSTTEFTIGGREPDHFNDNFKGRLGEFVEINDITTATREKMEGYLAWKWGLEANLPSDHPYKTAAPLSDAN